MHTKIFSLAVLGMLTFPIYGQAVNGRNRPRCQLEGTWALYLKLEHSRVGEKPVQDTISGAIVLHSIDSLDSSMWKNRGVYPTCTGEATVDFRKIGVHVDTVGIRRLHGWILADGRTQLILNPTIDHGNVELNGLVTADSIFGSWGSSEYIGGATGHFIMKKSKQ